ncbi:hypothetical protein PC118_g2340 [Phytophthora cactorum]|uniref:Uncharacterized protein n=1 Tax=Phytophthora cactorum TaxID=29920 RepID=A0A8T1GQG9_9STRA|nr:hypothetical protein PC111_g654 [Phytophthora cactorum]KAG2944676.1 hypothetical protein PC115_g121 [Phytophthora cactorum]KAG2952199.1 hypothetical protein PC117_g2970 [Phytophthora cactorum]KAG2996620.1 hypothetical protein PC118_g2340 [Phytophthora cactorum]KAG3003379.1 hypothetical protein PC120_g19145 [Phytophthora cactorum]
MAVHESMESIAEVLKSSRQQSTGTPLGNGSNEIMMDQRKVFKLRQRYLPS